MTIKNETQDQKINQALQLEIQAFCDENRLTPREAEVVFVLAEGIVRIKDVADRLQLSPNTVNNHVNSIFAKTRARSKSQLLAVLLGRIANDLRSAKVFHRRPKLLLLTSDTSFHQTATSFFSGNGFLLQDVNGALEFPELQLKLKATNFAPHYLLVDLDSVKGTKADWIKWAAEKYSAMVAFVSSRSTQEERSEAMHLGAVDCLGKPLDLELLLKVFLCHYIEDEQIRQSILDCRKQSAIPCREPLEVNFSNSGRGGFFISSQEIERIYGITPSVGQMLDLNLKWGFGPRKNGSLQMIPARGQVVWSKDHEGAGVRLLSSGDPDLRNEMVSLMSDHAVSSYIPTRIQNQAG